jgi:hypothetical protein
LLICRFANLPFCRFADLPFCRFADLLFCRFYRKLLEVRMPTRKRIRPLIKTSEAFSMPQVILLPAMLLSCALIPMSLLMEPVSIARVAGMLFAALTFSIIFVLVIVIPAFHARTLKENGVDATALILQKGERERTLFTPQSRIGMIDSYVVFEFTPKGETTPLRLEAEVGKLHSRLAEGQSAKIRYAASNPRIVRFKGE